MTQEQITGKKNSQEEGEGMRKERKEEVIARKSTSSSSRWVFKNSQNSHDFFKWHILTFNSANVEMSAVFLQNPPAAIVRALCPGDIRWAVS